MAIEARTKNGDVIFENAFWLHDMALRGYAVKEGLDPTGGGESSLVVNIAEGYYWFNGEICHYDGGYATLSPHTTYPKKALISINEAGELIVTYGSAAAARPATKTGPETFFPQPPPVPSDSVTLCEVWIPAAAVGIEDSNIHDMRVISKVPHELLDYGLAFEGTVEDVSGAPKFICDLKGFGDDYFKDYWVYVVWRESDPGTPPQGEKKKCAGYVSDTGEFDIGAFSVALAVGDKVHLLHSAIVGDIIVEVGEADDAATADDLSDIESTSVHAKLRRLLLSVINPAHTLKSLIEKMGDDTVTVKDRFDNIDDAEGTIFDEVDASTLDKGDGSNADHSPLGSLARYMTDLLDDATNGLAAIKEIASDIVGYVYDAGHDLPSLLAKMGDDDQTVKERFDTLEAAIGAPCVTPASGTLSFDETSSAVQQVFEIALTAPAKVSAIWLDMANVTQDTTIRVYHKIDGSSYRVFQANNWLTTMEDGVLIDGFTAEDDIKVTLQCGGGGVGSVNIPYRVR